MDDVSTWKQFLSRRAGDNPVLQTLVIPIPAGTTLPDFSAQVIVDPGQWVKMPGVTTIERRGLGISPGLDPSTYAYIQPTIHANLYRVPIH